MSGVDRVTFGHLLFSVSSPVSIISPVDGQTFTIGETRPAGSLITTIVSDPPEAMTVIVEGSSGRFELDDGSLRTTTVNLHVESPTAQSLFTLTIR